MVISEQGCRQSRRSSMGQHEATSRSSVLGSGGREPTRNAGTKKKGKKQSRDARGSKAGTLTRFNLHTPLGHSRSLDASRRVSAEAASWSREEAIAHRRHQCRQSADDEGDRGSNCRWSWSCLLRGYRATCLCRGGTEAFCRAQRAGGGRAPCSTTSNGLRISTCRS